MRVFVSHFFKRAENESRTAFWVVQLGCHVLAFVLQNKNVWVKHGGERVSAISLYTDSSVNRLVSELVELRHCRTHLCPSLRAHLVHHPNPVIRPIAKLTTQPLKVDNATN